MDLGFKQIIGICPATPKPVFPEVDYLQLRDELFSAHTEFCKLQQELDIAFKAQSFLKSHKVDSSIFNYLCDSIGFEEYVELPVNCITVATESVCTEICLEGLGSFIANVCKKIIAFFKKLYETIMNFFGIRTYRHRQTESRLNSTLNKLSAMRSADFIAVINSTIRCNAPTANIKELTKICNDLNVFYLDLNACKDLSNLNALTSRLGGTLTKLGHKVQNEYKLVKDTGLPYTEFAPNTDLSVNGDLGITNKGDVQSLIRRVMDILDTILDLQRWYPANLKKYAARATEFSNQSVNDPESAALQAESLKELNNEQKCQAFLCAAICLYTTCVEYLCARTIATTGTVVANVKE